MLCPNCESESTFFRRVYRDYRWGRNLRYQKCLHCLVEFHIEIDDPESFYTSGEHRLTAGRSNAMYQNICSTRARAQVRWLDNSFPSWRELDSILDIGAFRGTAVEILREQGFNAVGYEIDPVEAERSEFVHTDISGIENVDILWFSHVLEHTNSAINLLKEHKGRSNLAFIDVPYLSYQLPHVLVFDEISLRRVVDLAGMNILAIDPARLMAVTKW